MDFNKNYNLSNLKSLNLTCEKLTKKHLNYFKNLVKFVLTSTNINQEVMESFENLEALEYLVFNNCNWIGRLKVPRKLKHLELFNSPCLSINASIDPDNLNSLESLRLNNSLFKENELNFVENLVNLTSLNVINLPNLKLKSMIFRKLVNLKCLNLSGKNVFDNSELSKPMEIPKELFLSNLTHILLTKAGLTYFNALIFSQTPNLTHLDLSGNKVKLYSNSFCYLENLLWLNLSSNGLRWLPSGVFSKLSKLETLNLSNNYLAYISKTTLKPLVSLNNFDLSANNLLNFKKSLNSFANAKKLSDFRDSAAYSKEPYKMQFYMLPLYFLFFFIFFGVPFLSLFFSIWKWK